MSEQERLELERMKQLQARLEQELASLGRQLSRLEQRLSSPARDLFTAAPQVPPPTSRPVETAFGAAHPGKLQDKPGLSHAEVPSPFVPPVIPKPVSAEPERVPTAAEAPVKVSDHPARPSQSERSPERQPTAPSPAPSGAHSFEMRLGTYWLVRIGIVMVLTALVFFGNFAYQNFVVKLGPGGKVALLYIASALLLGAGAWWQRKAVKESLRNYAQVLFAGGLAAVYFTTYAAHHLEHLRVISSAGWDGVLLLAWTAFMVWVADRKKSEVLALFAVGLAYYASIMTRVGSFTLYSNLVLTVAAVFFLVRNRWAALSFASLIASYAAYAFWRFFGDTGWHWASPDQGLWAGTYFLMSYWLVFTAAVFLSKAEKLAGESRAGFLTLNNGAFFAMFLLTMLQVREGGFWKFCLGYGTVLLILAELARRMLASEPLAKNSYLTQGLLLVTLGLILKFTGMQLSLVLATESVVLLVFGQRRHNLVLLTGAYLAAALAIGWGIDGLPQMDTPEFQRRGLILGLALGGLMMVNVVLAHRQTASVTTTARPQPAYFTVLALVAWAVVTWHNCSQAHFPLALAVEGAVLTFSIYILRVREVSLFAQGYLLLAHVTWLVNVQTPGQAPPWWNPVMMIALTLCLSHWWQKQKVLELRSQLGLVWQMLYALAIVGVLYFWLVPKVEAPIWLALTSLLALTLTAYGVSTRAWFIAACGQIFMLVSGVQFVWQLAQRKPEWFLPLAPITALGLLSFSTVLWFKQKPEASQAVRQPLLQLAVLYRWVGLVMSLWWVCEYIPARERTWVLILLGLLVFLWAGWRSNPEALLFSAAFTLFGLALFWVPLEQATTVYWLNLVAILVLLAEQRIAKHLPERYHLDSTLHSALIILGGLSLWLYLSRWVLQVASGFYLTASWSALALVLFTLGIVLRERMYRWLGLGVLACALGRVVIFDVWKLETLYRVLSFLALGIALLVLGFIYNKYQEKIKEWL